MPRRLTIVLLLAVSTALAIVAARAEGPSTHPSTMIALTEPTAPKLKVQMWTVLVVDAATGQANTDGLVHSCLPEFAEDKRFDASKPPPEPAAGNGRVVRIVNGQVVQPDDKKPAGAAPTTEPSPLGVIRFSGSFDGKIDVDLKAHGATFFGEWPPPEVRSDELLWRDLVVTTTAPTTQAVVPADSVFGALRSAGAPYMSTSQPGKPPVAERFLAFDLSMEFKPQMQASIAKDGSIGVTNTGHGPLHDLVFYRYTKSGIEVGDVGELAVAPAAPAAMPATTTAMATMPAATMPATTTGPSAAIRVTTLPTTAAATASQPAAPPAIHVTATTRPVDIAAVWTKIAASAGLDPVDAGLVGPVVASFADDDQRFTAVYRMDAADAEKLFPIEVVPTPASVQRFVVVVVRNVDPASKTAIDTLIRQLGDDDWAVRTAAMHALTGYGPAAMNKLQAASNDKDPEIAWRAQRLMERARR
jgi:hypothetical protein